MQTPQSKSQETREFNAAIEAALALKLRSRYRLARWFILCFEILVLLAVYHNLKHANHVLATLSILGLILCNNALISLSMKIKLADEAERQLRITMNKQKESSNARSSN